MDEILYVREKYDVGIACRDPVIAVFLCCWDELRWRISNVRIGIARTRKHIPTFDYVVCRFD